MVGDFEPRNRRKKCRCGVVFNALSASHKYHNAECREHYFKLDEEAKKKKRIEQKQKHKQATPQVKSVPCAIFPAPTIAKSVVSKGVRNIVRHTKPDVKPAEVVPKRVNVYREVHRKAKAFCGGY